MVQFFTVCKFETDRLLFILDSFKILDLSLEKSLNNTSFPNDSQGKT